MIVLNKVSYAAGGAGNSTLVLDDIDFEIPTNRRFGLLGLPGSGKTTLIRLLAGLEQPTSGTIDRYANLSFPIGYEGLFKRHLSVAENLQQLGEVFGDRIASVISFVQAIIEISPDDARPLSSLSPDDQRRFIFAAGYALPFDCYLVDERFSCGPIDEDFRTKCIVMLQTRASQNGILLASSRPSVIQRFCDVAAVLEDGKIRQYPNVKEAVAAYGRLASLQGTPVTTSN